MFYTSKYLDQFLNLLDKKELYRVNGGRVVIEVLPRPEVKTQGGLIMAAPSGFAKGGTFETQSGTLGVVLLTGDGYVDTDGTTFDIDLKPGNVVLVNDFGIKTLSIFPGLADYAANSLAIIDETTVQMTWPDFEAFDKYSKALVKKS